MLNNPHLIDWAFTNNRGPNCLHCVWAGFLELDGEIVLLHIAQSVYHDIIPAKAMGLSAIRVDRRKGQEDFGATRPASCDSDLEVPDLKSLVLYMGLEPHWRESEFNSS